MGYTAKEMDSPMIRLALMLAALLLAATPAALGVIRNASFTPETPVRIMDRNSSPKDMNPQQPDTQVDNLNGDDQDLDSPRIERRQAHNDGDD